MKTKMNNQQSSLDKFGEFIVVNLRDKAIETAEMLLENGSKSPQTKILQDELSTFNAAQKAIVANAVKASIDAAIHDFLFAIEEQADFENDIQIIVNEENIVEMSDGLQGELFTQDGWFEKYSKFKGEK